MPNPSTITMKDEDDSEREPTTNVALNKFEIYALLRLRQVGQVNHRAAENKLREALEHLDTRYHD